MNNMPAKLRKEMEVDEFYQKCCLTGLGFKATDENRFNPKRVEWHHNLIFAGRQVQKKFAILPVLKKYHDQEKKPEIKELLNWVMLNRMTPEELSEYSKVVHWKFELEKLNEKYGEWKEGVYPLDE